MAVSQSLKLYQGTQDVVNNTSKLRILWTSTQTGQSYNNYTKTAKYWISVNGGPEQEYSVSYKLPKTTTQTIADVTVTVPHDDSGNCVVAVRTWMDTGISSGEVELSQDIVLTPIPRANTISAADAYIGGTMRITVARKSASYLHSIKYAFGSLSGYLTVGGFSVLEAKTAATDFAIPIPCGWDAEVLTSKTAPIALTCTTYLGTEKIGESATEATIRTDGTFAPVINASVVDINETSIALTGNASRLIQGVSTARATLEATAMRGATIKNTEINGVQTSALEVEAVQNGSFTFKAVDSRGWETSQVVGLSVIPYIPLTAIIEAERDVQGANALTVAVKGNYYPGSFGAVTNTLNVKVRTSTGIEQTLIPVIDGNSYTAEISIDMDYQSAHDLYVDVSDKITALEKYQYVPKAVPIMMEGADWVRFNVPVINRLNSDEYIGRGDADETGLESWLERLMDTMPDASTRDIRFVCSAVTGCTVAAALYKHDGSYASILGHSYDEKIYHKVKYDGIWGATKKRATT